MENREKHEAIKGCLFCSASKSIEVQDKYKTMIAIQDKHPVTKGHLLIVPLRHVEDYFSLTDREKYDADTLLSPLTYCLFARYLRYVQKLILGISTTCLWLFFFVCLGLERKS